MKQVSIIISAVLICLIASPVIGQEITDYLLKVDQIEMQLNKLQGEYRKSIARLESKLAKTVSGGDGNEEMAALTVRVEQLNAQVEQLTAALASAQHSQDEMYADLSSQFDHQPFNAAMDEPAAGEVANTESSGKLGVDAGMDFYNRYVWRGLEIGGAPSLQPYLAFNYAGLELGFWGAYATANNADGADEADIWLAYSLDLPNGMSVTALVTDYYFPNSGVRIGNYNDYDALRLEELGGGVVDTVENPGAHTFEWGLAVSAPGSVPLSFSAYWNFHNDPGNNAYFQLDYAIAVNNIDLGFSIGATPGSEDNPDYYGSDNFQVINLGVTASKSIKITNDFSLPISVSYTINPRLEKSYILFGLSI